MAISGGMISNPKRSVTVDMEINALKKRVKSLYKVYTSIDISYAGNIEDDFTKKISTVYLVENDVIQDDMMKMLVNTALTLEGVIDSTITVNSITEDQANELMSEEKSVVVKLEEPTKWPTRKLNSEKMFPIPYLLLYSVSPINQGY